ncbi:MAG: rod shape-determining protein RodA [Chloroflexi bacterium]|nr:rod shape-determining protein RodA [Chloroflexota bacterium]
MERSERQPFLYFDVWLLSATLLLAVIGVLMIYSATACITNEPLDWQSTTIRQILWLAGGLGAMFVLTLIDYRVFAALRWPIWVVTIAILLAVQVIGIITHGAQRWIPIAGFQFQPSEFSKLFLVLVVAKYMADHEEQMSNWRYLALSFVFVAVPIFLVYLQPDLGTTIVLALAWGVMALAAGMKLRDVLIIVTLLVVAAPLLWNSLRPYQQERLLTFVDPGRDPLGAGYNVDQARTAIGSGGLWGSGFCSGTQTQLRFLRIRQSDFIFSVIGEELGFVGALFVLGLFVFILLRLVRAAMLARTTYGKLVAVGVAAVIFVQSYVNLGMNLGLMPVTGIPLPFVSAGGSSLISLLAAEGVVQSILTRHRGLQLEGSGKKYE